MINIKQKSTIELKQNLEGKHEKILIYECKNCSYNTTKLFKNKNCIPCFLQNLYNNRNKKFNYILINNSEILIEKNQLLLFSDYFKQIQKILKIFSNIETFKEKKCYFKEFECKIFHNYFSALKPDEVHFYNPILVNNYIQSALNIISKIDKNNIIDFNCQKCYISIKNSIEEISALLSNLKIICEFNDFNKLSKNPQELCSFYEYLLTKNYSWQKKKDFSKKKKSKNHKELIEVYHIGDGELFQVSIFNIIENTEKRYEVDISFNSESEKHYFNMLIENLLKNLTIAKLDHVILIENLIKLYKKEALKLINLNFELSDKQKSKIAFFTSLKKLNLDKIFPLLIDDYIEEIFLDSPEDFIYLNHQTYGRCRTSIKFNIKELDRIKTFLRLYSGQRLDFLNPSIKHVIKNNYFFCRFAIDVEPINFKKFALDIRKLNKKIFTIQDLLKNQTLSPLMATFLYFCILRRVNITTTGETDTGKTTLINALDLLTPKEFRKIYIENVIESLNQDVFGKHQLKYKVDSLNELMEIKYSKSNQIKTLLHRTPDLIYLGEILTKEEAEAMFHCLAAGLRGFQTIHSNDVDSLINRFLHHFKINLSCLNDLNLVLLMKKEFFKRRVISINEINLENSNKEKIYNTIFNYNPESQKWDNIISLYDTSTVRRLKIYEDLNFKKFSKIINLFYDIFQTLLKIEKINVKELTEFFHKVSYYSMRSFNLLEDFWINWKNLRGLNL